MRGPHARRPRKAEQAQAEQRGRLGLGDDIQRRVTRRRKAQHDEVRGVVIGVEVREQPRQARARGRVGGSHPLPREDLAHAEDPVADRIQDRARGAQHDGVGTVLKIEVRNPAGGLCS